MKVKALVNALGKETNKIGDILEVDNEAGKALIEQGYAQEVKAPAKKK